MDRLPDGANGLREVLHAVHLGNVARLEVNFRNPAIVTGDESEENLGQESAFLWPQPAHDSEINRGEPALPVDEEVPLMHVGVEEAVANRMSQEGLDDDASKLRQIEPRAGERRQIRQVQSVDPFDREDVLGGAIPVYGGHPEVCVITRVFRVLGGSRGLEPEVHLHLHCARQRFDDIVEAKSASLGRVPLSDPGCEVHIPKIAAEASFDAWPKDLDRDVAVSIARLHLGPMDLSYRSGRDRLPDLGEKVRHGNAERSLYGRERLLLRERRNPVLQFLQFLCGVRADDVRARGEELPEFDVGRPQPRHGAREPFLVVAGVPPRQKLGEAERHPGGGRQNAGIDVDEHAFARQNPTGMGETRDVTESSEHDVATSELPAGMDGHDATRQLCVACPAEAGGCDLISECVRGGELGYRFDQIAVRLAVAGDGLAHCRDGRERVRAIRGVQQRHVHVGEFEAQETASPLQDAKRLGQSLFTARHVPDAEGDRVGVEGLVRERQALPRWPPRNPPCPRGGASGRAPRLPRALPR